MIVAVDVHYAGDTATAACVGFASWADEVSAYEHVIAMRGVAPYEPGAFFRRELPPLMEVLKRCRFDLVVIDGYVWLGVERRGLGAHLYTAFGKPVVGVAKTYFHDAPAIEVLRGASKRPLYVTAVATPSLAAAANVRRMHGPNRIPTLLQRADRLCRAG